MKTYPLLYTNYYVSNSLIMDQLLGKHLLFIITRETFLLL